MAETNVVQALTAPNKYVQGRGVLYSLGRYVGELGQDALGERLGPGAAGAGAAERT